MIPEHRPNLSATSGPLEDVTEAGGRSRTADPAGARPVPLDGDQATSFPGDPSAATPEVPAKPGDQVPARLRALRRWTRHDHRRPITTNGEPAWVMDPPTWTTYARAKASSTGDGLGFVLDGDGIVSLDLSHCVIDGGRAAWLVPGRPASRGPPVWRGTGRPARWYPGRGPGARDGRPPGRWCTIARQPR